MSGRVVPDLRPLILAATARLRLARFELISIGEAPAAIAESSKDRQVEDENIFKEGLVVGR